jgi:hypothetical protein
MPPQIQNAFPYTGLLKTLVAMTDLADFEELPIAGQALRVMEMYKLALDLTHYRSLRYRLLALAGHREARRGQLAFAAGEKAAVRLVNSSPAFQATWRRLCDEEPPHSPAKPFLPRVLRSTCVPLPPFSDEQRRRRRNEDWALSNQCQNLIDQLNELDNQ